MTTQLHQLQNVTRPYKRRKLLGRGVGSKSGKTCGRGHKGAGSRSGYKSRAGYIGGGVPLHKVVPTRGFSNAPFQKRYDVINFVHINEWFEDGETVSVETLQAKGFLKGPTHGLKVLATGELKKKVAFHVEALSKTAKEAIEKLKLQCNI